MQKPQVATYILAVSIISLAFAIVFFTLELSQIRGDLPAILQQIESTSEKIEPVVVEMGEIRNLVPPILNEVAEARQQIPAILKEMAELRKEVPSVLEEIESIRLLVPELLTQADLVRKEVPSILKSIDDVSRSVTLSAKEVKAIRPLVPVIMSEIEAVRKEIEATRHIIPGTMDRLESIVEKADEAGQKASEGAVSGIFTGIIKAPFKTLSGIGRTASGKTPLSDEDILKATAAAISLTAQEVGSTKAWANPSTGHKGTFTLLKNTKENSSECQSLKHQVWNGNTSLYEKQLKICRGSGQSEWELQK
ncbi:MAG: hypothetical protein KZQ73_00960 [Candidatus Thiodiazotropha sp. (ex Semelilucina semeliformis)]|nr:hypothetical protein [Candidatus Thiodiazotropha sp. (ex Semelilucina semeliformis)]